MKHFIIIIISILFIQHCEPYVFFDSPQPMTKKVMLKFTDELQGKYVNKDSIELYISEKMIIKKSLENFDILKQELDTMNNYSIKGNYIYGPDIDSAKILEIKNDTIFGEFYFTDTIFSISNEHLLKKYKDTYFLNLCRENENWEVVLLNYFEDSIQFRSIHKDYELDYIKENFEVNEIYNDSTSKVSKYIIHADNKKFLNYCNSNGFQEIEVWKKTNK